MMTLDEHTRRALQARDGPPPGAQARNLAALEARLGGGGGGGESTWEGPSGAEVAANGQVAWAAKVVGATLGLTAAGLLVLGAGAAGYQRVKATDEAALAPSTPPSRPAEGPPPAPPSGLAPASPEAAQTARVARDTPETGKRPSPDARASAPRRATPPTTSAPQSASTAAPAGPASIEAELALIAAAKTKLVSDPAQALTELESHAKQFPRGVLATERQALRVQALCALDRPDQARTAWDQWSRARPSPSLRAQVEEKCRALGMDLGEAGD